DKLSAAVTQLEQVSRALANAMDLDAASYDAVLTAYKLPKDTPEDDSRREAAIAKALSFASEVPMGVAELVSKLYEQLGQLEPITPASMKSDLQVARMMAVAAAHGALANVETNLESLTSRDFVIEMRFRIAAVHATLAPRPVAAAH
ncbi:MAG: cyclodeaminase/cyclohydrolase family protein, partial [Candidatus Acidiferrales bacterium]